MANRSHLTNNKMNNNKYNLKFNNLNRISSNNLLKQPISNQMIKSKTMFKWQMKQTKMFNQPIYLNQHNLLSLMNSSLNKLKMNNKIIMQINKWLMKTIKNSNQFNRNPNQNHK